MMSIKRTEVGPIMSRIAEHNSVVYLCGLTADDRSADVKGQTKEILDKIDARLASAGSCKSKLLTATVYLSDLSTTSSRSNSSG